MPLKKLKIKSLSSFPLHEKVETICHFDVDLKIVQIMQYLVWVKLGNTSLEVANKLVDLYLNKQFLKAF